MHPDISRRQLHSLRRLLPTHTPTSPRCPQCCARPAHVPRIRDTIVDPPARPAPPPAPAGRKACCQVSRSPEHPLASRPGMASHHLLNEADSLVSRGHRLCELAPSRHQVSIRGPKLKPHVPEAGSASPSPPGFGCFGRALVLGSAKERLRPESAGLHLLLCPYLPHPSYANLFKRLSALLGTASRLDRAVACGFCISALLGGGDWISNPILNQFQLTRSRSVLPWRHGSPGLMVNSSVNLARCRLKLFLFSHGDCCSQLTSSCGDSLETWSAQPWSLICTKTH